MLRISDETPMPLFVSGATSHARLSVGE